MTSVSTNLYIDKLKEIGNRYINTLLVEQSKLYKIIQTASFSEFILSSE